MSDVLEEVAGFASELYEIAGGLLGEIEGCKWWVVQTPYRGQPSVELRVRWRDQSWRFSMTMAGILNYTDHPESRRRDSERRVRELKARMLRGDVANA